MNAASAELSSHDKRLRFRWKLWGLFVFVVLTRVPFLTAGYGVEIDGWRVALAAKHIAQNGLYEVSRFPGYPLQELVCSLFWRGGPGALNGLAAVLAGASCVLFAKIARDLGCRAPIAAAVALAFVPLFYVSSVGAKDYVWAVTALLGALWFVLRRRPIFAGICLGLAIGCRLTSGMMALPLAVLLAFDQGKLNHRRFALFAAASTIVASLAFVPVIWRYGTGFLQFYHSHGYPDAATVLHRATIEVWGGIGLVSLLLVFATAFPRFLKTPKREVWQRPAAAALAFLMLLALFLRLPDQAGYLLPLTVLVVLGVAIVVPARVLPAFAASMLLSSFLTIDRHGFAAGPILRDRIERQTTVAQIDSFLAFAETLPGRNVIAVGGWAPQIEVLRPELGDNLKCVYLLTPNEFAGYRQDGFAVWYLPVIRSFNMRVHGFDLAAAGAQDLRVLHERMLAAKSIR